MKASPEAITQAVQRMVDHAREHDIGTITMPTIGAGLGLDWPEVRTILDGVIPDELDVTVYSSPIDQPDHGLREHGQRQCHPGGKDLQLFDRSKLAIRTSPPRS